MKKFIKSLLLGTVIIGMAVACQDTPVSSNTSSTSSSNTSSTVTSSSSEILTSSIASSSISSSSTSSSATSSSSSSSSSSVAPAPTLTGITLNTDNVKKNYYTGEALDLTGLVVTATYSDNSTTPVTSYVTNPTNGTVLNTIGEQKVTVTYDQKTADFKVTVTKAPKTSWTEEEAKIMSDNLYGIVLPYTGFEESVVTYDAQRESLFIQGGTLTNSSLADYAKLMVAASFTSLTETAYIYHPMQVL